MKRAGTSCCLFALRASAFVPRHAAAADEVRACARAYVCVCVCASAYHGAVADEVHLSAGAHERLERSRDRVPHRLAILSLALREGPVALARKPLPFALHHQEETGHRVPAQAEQISNASTGKGARARTAPNAIS